MQTTPPSTPSLSEPDYADRIGKLLLLRRNQVQSVIRLSDEGNTIPFIARYRKEMTGELDEHQIRAICSQYESEKALHERKVNVLRLLAEQGVLEDASLSSELQQRIQEANSLTAVDDVYRPYRPKRKTRATVAREKGLAPLAAWLLSEEARTLSEDKALAWIEAWCTQSGVMCTSEEALQGAADIFAEEVADHATSRAWIRDKTRRAGWIQSVAVEEDVRGVYESYADFREPVSKCAHHRVLAMNRGEREGVLRVSIVPPEEEILTYLTRAHIPGARGLSSGTQHSPSFVYRLLEVAVKDAYKRLIERAIERDIRNEMTDKAENHAIGIFGENLKHLLMQPPIRDTVVLGVDPAYRTGCKLAVVDPTGKLLEVAVIYPTPPRNQVEEARTAVFRLLQRYKVGLVVIGNGTASRETEAFISEALRIYRDVDTHRDGNPIPYMVVSEAGASVYSASPIASEEFPNLDVAERSAISIARRTQDPLAELVKIDPQSVGVGQYQHDVSQVKLSQQLGAVVETAVNQVGIDLNTASPSLLGYVAGLNQTVAKNIVRFREENGPFRDRKQLAKVPRLGKKTIEQCVGFLRIRDGDEVLDNTPIHPESYSAVERLLKRTGRAKRELRDGEVRAAWLAELMASPMEELAEDVSVGVPTLRDILEALEKPGRDPRESIPEPLKRTEAIQLEDLAVGTELMGTVRNVVDFGAFVDVGLKNDGLVHLSQLSDRFVKHPMDVVAVGDIVKVRVLQVDVQKGRLSLSMKGV